MIRTEVECRDLTYRTEWLCSDDIEEAHLVNVLVSGVVVGETDDELKVSCLYALETERSGYTVIVPKGCIIHRTDRGEP